MKTLLLIGVLLAAPAVGPTISQADRDKAVTELEGSQKMFLDATRGLSEAQWNFKPAPDRWSVAECAEHIGVTEGYVFQMITEKALKGPAEPEKRKDVQMKDDAIVPTTIDRSAKFKAPETIQPTRRWTTPDEISKNVLQNRAVTLAFVNTTQEDLRNHFMDHPVFKTLDTYQWMLLISGHMRRHTEQILEVKADPNFPKQ
jgi:DinB superfamily